MNHFGALDWLLTALSLLGTLWIGVLTRRYVGGIEDYLVASRGMGVYVGTASLVSTEIGIITYMYHAQYGFLAGFAAFVVGLITISVCFVVGQTGFVISRLRELEIMTVPEYLERRYTRRVRVLAGVIMAFGGCLNLGIFPIIEARFLTITAGIPAQYVNWTMAALLLLALAYTALGGMVSLIVTNYVQYVLLAIGTCSSPSACLWHVGWSGMTRAVTRAHGPARLRSLRRARRRAGLRALADPALDRAHDRLAVRRDALLLGQERGHRPHRLHAHERVVPGPRGPADGVGRRRVRLLLEREPAARGDSRRGSAGRNGAPRPGTGRQLFRRNWRRARLPRCCRRWTASSNLAEGEARHAAGGRRRREQSPGPPRGAGDGSDALDDRRACSRRARSG